MFYSQVHLQHCSSCEQLHMLTMEWVTISVDKEGKASTNEEQIVDRLLLNPENYAMLQQHFEELPEYVEEESPDEPDTESDQPDEFPDIKL